MQSSPDADRERQMPSIVSDQLASFIPRLRYEYMPAGWRERVKAITLRNLASRRAVLARPLRPVPLHGAGHDSFAQGRVERVEVEEQAVAGTVSFDVCDVFGLLGTPEPEASE
jgi:hypothetical protein